MNNKGEAGTIGKIISHQQKGNTMRIDPVEPTEPEEPIRPPEDDVGGGNPPPKKPPGSNQ